MDSGLYPEIEVRDIMGVTREEWGARPAGELKPMALPITTVTLSYTGSKSCHTKEECIRIVKKLQKKHMLRGFPDIRYNFLIGSDGYVYEGRGWDIEPEKHKKFPKLKGKSVDIAMIWRKENYRIKKLNFDEIPVLLRSQAIEDNKEPPPTNEMIHTFYDLIEYGKENKYVIEECNTYNIEHGPF